MASFKKKNPSFIARRVLPTVIGSIIVLHVLYLPWPAAGENPPEFVSVQSDVELADIVDPFKSTCYDWKGSVIPCSFKGPYAERLFDKPIPDPRFIDNQDGTMTDNLTGLICSYLFG